MTGLVDTDGDLDRDKVPSSFGEILEQVGSRDRVRIFGVGRL